MRPAARGFRRRGVLSCFKCDGRGAAQGDVVTVLYTTEAGHARATVVTQHTKIAMNDSQPANTGGTAAPAVQQPMVTAMNNAGPSRDGPMATKSGQPAGSKPVMTDTGKAAAKDQPIMNGAPVKTVQRLPETATNLPLIGLTGLLALAGGLALRAAASAATARSRGAGDPSGARAGAEDV
jgi:hypothetical protein